MRFKSMDPVKILKLAKFRLFEKNVQRVSFYHVVYVTREFTGITR